MTSANNTKSLLQNGGKALEQKIADGKVVYDDLFEEWQKAVRRWNISPEELELRDRAVSYSFVPEGDSGSPPSGIIRNQAEEDKSSPIIFYKVGLQRFLGSTIDIPEVGAETKGQPTVADSLAPQRGTARISLSRIRHSFSARMSRLRTEVNNLLYNEADLKESIPWMAPQHPGSGAIAIIDCYSNLKELADLTSILRSSLDGCGNHKQFFTSETEWRLKNLSSELVHFDGKYCKSHSDAISVNELMGTDNEAQQLSSFLTKKAEHVPQTFAPVCASISVNVNDVIRMKAGLLTAHVDNIRCRFTQLHNMVLGPVSDDAADPTKPGTQRGVKSLSLTDFAARLLKLLNFVPVAGNSCLRRLHSTGHRELVPQLETEVDLLTILSKFPVQEAVTEPLSGSDQLTDQLDVQMEAERKVHGKLLKLRDLLDGPYLSNWHDRVEEAMKEARNASSNHMEIQDQIIRVTRLQANTTHSKAGLEGAGMETLIDRLHSQCTTHKKALQAIISNWN